MSSKDRHAWTGFGRKIRFPWSYCRKCGLVALNNAATKRVVYCKS